MCPGECVCSLHPRLIVHQVQQLHTCPHTHLLQGAIRAPTSTPATAHREACERDTVSIDVACLTAELSRSS
jgi:hypothetical protein